MRRLAAALLAVMCAQCGGTTNGTGVPPSVIPPDPPVPIPTPIPAPQPAQTFVGAGDVAMCDANSEGTAKLLDGIGGTVFTLGDLAYNSGTADEFRRCYDPTWGRHKARTRPAPGNHEYVTPGAAPYFAYFGANAGPPGLGYYSFDIGAWHAIALNSNIDVRASSTQAAWLRADLAANESRCVIAYWHHPRFTSGPNGPTGFMDDFWRILYEAGADVVLNGHDHMYERFAPQTPEGIADPVRGIRQFTAGTGGALIYQTVAVAANSERRIHAFGVLKLTLETDRYQWEFVGVPGAGTDAGTGTCH